MLTDDSPVARFLSSRLMVVLPEFTDLEPFRDRNLNTWRKSGSHSLAASSNSSITLNVNSRDYAANVFAEAQHLLNHASENRAYLISAAHSTTEPSPSWALVSLYYFSLYVALAWTRVANGAILYLDKAALLELTGSVTVTPRGGAFRAQFTTLPSTGQSQVEMKKCNNSHFHEAVWTRLTEDADSASNWLAATCANRQQTIEEENALRSLQLFTGFSFTDPRVWPSKLRNAINYRPGYSYRSIIKNNFLHLNSLLKRPALSSLSHVLEMGEQAKFGLRGVKDPLENINDSVELLLAQTLLCEAFVEQALVSICSIRDLSCSALSLRRRFNKSNCADAKILTPLPIAI
jgi:hypothetical protein